MAILDSVEDPVFVKDHQSRLVLVNDAFCDLFGRERNDIIGKTLAEDVPVEEREHFLKIDKQVIANGKELFLEETLTIRGGESRTILTHKKRISDERGNKYLVGTIRDITTQKHAESLSRINRLNELQLSAAKLLSMPDVEPVRTFRGLTQLLSTHFNAVCDISVLNRSSGTIRPIAMYHSDNEVHETIENLFTETELKEGQGLVGSVIDTGKEVCIRQVPESMQVGPAEINPKIVPVSLMYVPLIGSRGVIGSLNLTRIIGTESFDEHELEQIRTIGKYISLFVENSLLKEEQKVEEQLRLIAEAQLERDKRWAEFKLEVSSVLANVSSELGEILQEFAFRVSVFFDVVCDIHLLNDEDDTIKLIALHHTNDSVRRTIEDHLVNRKLKVGQGMVGKVVETGVEFFVEKLPVELRKKSEEHGVNPVIVPVSFAYLPMSSRGMVLGTLDLTRLSGQQALTEEELQRARDLAGHAAMIIENRVLQAKQRKEIRLRKKAEQKLERTSKVLSRMEAETRAILNTIPIYIARVSKDFKYLFLNEMYRNMNIDPRKTEGKHISTVLGEDGFERLKSKFERVSDGNLLSYDYDAIMADGVHRYFSVALAPDITDDGNLVGYYVCSTDITSKVEAEMTAKLTQDRMETLSLNSGDAFFFHDSEQKILDVNQVAIDMLGYSREELLRMKAYQIDPRWKGEVYQRYLKELPANLPQTFDTTVFRKDGTEVPVEVRFVKRKEARRTYIQSLIRDRTEKREQELKLKQSENQLRLIFDNVEDFIATVSEEGVVESVNKTTQGVTQEDVIGGSVFDWYPDPEVRAKVVAGFELLRTTGKGFEVETNSYAGPDGSIRTYYNKYLAKFEDGKFYKAILIIRDITDEKNKERAEMNAVLRGQEQERKRLGAELHDGIGQILSAIALQVSQIREEKSVSDSEVLSDQLKKLNLNLQSAIREVRGISHDLMPEVLESFGLKEAVKQVCNSLQDRAGLQVKFDHVDLEPRYNPLVEMNLYRIAQELMNNIHKHSKCTRVFVSLMDHGDTLNLTVEDDGGGFDKNQDANGIGLKNVSSRVALMGGQIDVESAIGSGTLINIEVPKRVV